MFILVVAPTGNEAGWVWPVAILALVAWVVVPVSPEVVLREVGALLTERQEQS